VSEDATVTGDEDIALGPVRSTAETRAEIIEFINTDQSRLGEVFRGVERGLSADEIAAELGVATSGFGNPSIPWRMTYSMRTSRNTPTCAFVARTCDGCAPSPQVRGVGCDGRRKSAQTWRGFPARLLRDSGSAKQVQQIVCPTFAGKT
jgi:hypothetical protein